MSDIKYYIVVGQQYGGDAFLSDKKKMGRPFSANPKSAKIAVRINEEEAKILDSYCKKNNTSRSDGVREGIRRLEE